MNWNPTLRLIRYPAVFLVTVLLLVACGGDEDLTETSAPGADSSTTTQTADTSTSTTAPAPEPSPSTTAESAAGDGTVTVRLQGVDGYFIEGFEIGLRFETAAKDVIGATLWSDFVTSTGAEGIDAYYNSVLEQTVPAGTITILATANIGVGPGPVIPDPNGPLECRLTVEVPPGGQVDVEVGFDASNCLRQL